MLYIKAMLECYLFISDWVDMTDMCYFFWCCCEHQADGSTAGMTTKVNLSGLRRARTVVVVFLSSNEVCRDCSD